MWCYVLGKDCKVRDKETPMNPIPEKPRNDDQSPKKPKPEKDSGCSKGISGCLSIIVFLLELFSFFT
jgi:hypothetical protein